MNQQQSLSLKLEIIWWIFTAVVVLGILYPIYSTVSENFPFYWTNILFIITFITFTRLIFLLKHSLIASQEKIKIVLILLTPILLFYLVNQMNFFQTFLDENGMAAFLADKSIPKQEAMRKYITGELLLFGSGSVIAAAILPIRLIISIWRVRNRGTV